MANEGKNEGKTNEARMRDEEEAGKALRERSMREFNERSKGKPTPTQEENDKAALGEAPVGGQHEPDGSNIDEAATLHSGKELREKSAQEFAERSKGKPTPTQEEVDRAAMGETPIGSQHEPDGSKTEDVTTRALEGKPDAAYKTRQATPQQPMQQQPPHPQTTPPTPPQTTPPTKTG